MAVANFSLFTLHSSLLFVPLHPLSRNRSTGEMVEWSITVVLKTTVPRGTGGSNPSLSANKLNRADIIRCQSYFHCRSNLVPLTSYLSPLKRSVPHATRGGDGRQEGRECGYYHLHRNLNNSLLHSGSKISNLKSQISNHKA